MNPNRVRGGGGRSSFPKTGGRSGSYSHGHIRHDRQTRNPNSCNVRQTWMPKSSVSVSQKSGHDPTEGNHIGVSELEKNSPDSAASDTEKSPDTVSEQSGQNWTDSKHVGVSQLEITSPGSAANNTKYLNCASVFKDTRPSNESFPKYSQIEGKSNQTYGEKKGGGELGTQIWKLGSPDRVSKKSEHISQIGTPELVKKACDSVISSSEKLKSSCKDTCFSAESFNKHGHVEEKRDQMNMNQSKDFAGDLSESLYKASISCPRDISGANSTNTNYPRNPTENSNTKQSTVVAPFDIFLQKLGPPVLKLKPSLLATNKEKRKEIKRSLEVEKGRHLRPGMVLLKNYLSCDEQVKIVKKCRDLGLGSGGFYQPGYRDEAKLHLKMMCLGKNWDPETSKYESRRSTDGAIPPIIPDEFNQLVKRTIEDSHAVIRNDPKTSRESSVDSILPFMSPDICVVNFYTTTGRLGLHKDRDESQESLAKGLPVVSFSIGDSAEFLYRDVNDGEEPYEVVLESGDALIFGGKSRHIFHGVKAIIPKSAPQALLEETNLRPGRLNLTFRQY